MYILVASFLFTYLEAVCGPSMPYKSAEVYWLPSYRIVLKRLSEFIFFSDYADILWSI